MSGLTIMVVNVVQQPAAVRLHIHDICSPCAMTTQAIQLVTLQCCSATALGCYDGASFIRNRQSMLTAAAVERRHAQHACADIAQLRIRGGLRAVGSVHVRQPADGLLSAGRVAVVRCGPRWSLVHGHAGWTGAPKQPWRVGIQQVQPSDVDLTVVCRLGVLLLRSRYPSCVPAGPEKGPEPQQRVGNEATKVRWQNRRVASRRLCTFSQGNRRYSEFCN